MLRAKLDGDGIAHVIPGKSHSDRALCRKTPWPNNWTAIGNEVDPSTPLCLGCALAATQAKPKAA